MALYALVINGVVTEERNYDTPPETKLIDGKPVLRPIQTVTAEHNPETQYHTVSRKVQNLKVVDTWVVHDRPREEVDARFTAALKAHRYNAEESGQVPFELSPGTTAILRTDERSCNRITGKALEASLFPQTTVNWIAANGTFTLNAQQILGAAVTVAAYIQKCIDAETVVSANISSFGSTAEALAAFDAAMAT